MNKRHFFLVAVLATAVAGCGSSDKKSNKQLSYAATGTKLSEICTKAKAKAGSLSLSGDPQADAKVVEKVKAALDDGIKDVNDVKPPPELQSAYDEFKSLSDQQSGLLQSAIDAGSSGDKTGFNAALKQYQALGKQNDAAAGKLGATGCIG